MNRKAELEALIARIKKQEELTHSERIRVFGLAWLHGMNGLLNPEDDEYLGAKEDWY